MNLDGTVQDVETLIYREPRGWEVRYPIFDRPVHRDIRRLGFRNINTITTATLSVQAMLKGVSRASADYKVLFLSENSWTPSFFLTVYGLYSLYDSYYFA